MPPPSRGVKKEEENRILVNRYLVKRKLGMGNFGVVFLVEDLKAGQKDDKLKVVKEMSVEDLKPDETVDCTREAKFLSKFNHPGIVRFFDSFLDGEYFCLVTEFCDGGDLEDHITAYKTQGKHFEEAKALDWFVQLVKAVEYMHGRRVLHRDLKARNIFIKNDMVKLGDFGISRVLMGTIDMASTFTGTPYYMSPEVLKHVGYDEKSDVWSMGCILYEMCALKHTFDGQSLMSVMYKIVEGKVPKIPSRYSKEVDRIFTWMLTKDPAKRPSAANVASDSFISNHLMDMARRIEKGITLPSVTTDVAMIERERTELIGSLSNKTHLEDLRLSQNAAQMKEIEDQLASGHDVPISKKTDCPSGFNKSTWSKMTPKQKMIARKQFQADQNAAEVTMHGRANYYDTREQRLNIQEVNEGTIKPRHPVPSSYGDYRPRISSSPSDTYLIAREDIGTVIKDSYGYDDDNDDDDDDIVAVLDRPITGRARAGVGLDARLKEAETTLEYVPSGKIPKKNFTPLKKGGGKLAIGGAKPAIKKTPRGKSPKMVQQAKKKREADQKLVDAYLKEEFDEDVDQISSQASRISIDATAVTYFDAYSPAIKDQKVANMRTTCERKLGKETFRKVYDYLRLQRLAEKDENEIRDGLSKLVKNPQDCFDVDQLVFLEMSSS